MIASRRRRLAALLTAIAGTAPVLYPAWLLLSASRRPTPEPPDPEQWPELSVVVAAFREQAIIEAKVKDVRGQGYTGGVEVIVVADDRDTARAARSAGAIVLTSPARRGKSDAVNRGIAHATNPFVVLTDADTHLLPGSLEALARWFADPHVGAVAGEKRVADAGLGLYWRFESWIKSLESRRGTTIGVVGELVAVRRAVFRPLPEDVVVDDLWMGLDVIESGLSVRYEPGAVAIEAGSPTLAAEWERRTRTQVGLLDLLWRRRRTLRPRSPVAVELWGHKLMRTLLGPVAHAALLAMSVLSLRESRLGRIFATGHLLAGVALVRGTRGTGLSAPERAAAQLLFLQATALGAVIRFARGDRPAAWPKPERSAASRSVFDEGVPE